MKKRQIVNLPAKFGKTEWFGAWDARFCCEACRVTTRGEPFELYFRNGLWASRRAKTFQNRGLICMWCSVRVPRKKNKLENSDCKMLNIV